MSSKILLEDDANAMFGDGDEEEEEEDVVMEQPLSSVGVVQAVKEEEENEPLLDADKRQQITQESTVKAKVTADKGTGGETEERSNGVSSDSTTDPTGAATSSFTPPTLSTLPVSPPQSPPLVNVSSPSLLPTSLPPTSPFPHHNAGPTADRLRNAMSRISADPTQDAEAWQALITEAQSCYRKLLPRLYKLRIHGVSVADDSVDAAEADLLGRKLDWIEACYGTLLHYFPYSVAHYVQITEILLRLSALTRDEEEQCGPNSAGNTLGALGGGGVAQALSNPQLGTPDQGVATTPASVLMLHGMVASQTERQRRYGLKLERIFQLCLGIQPDGSPAIHGALDGMIDMECATSTDGARTVLAGRCPHSVDLWLLYVRERTWDASRSAARAAPVPLPPPGYTPTAAGAVASVLHQQYEESLRSVYRRRKEAIREAVTAAYEAALERGGGFAHNNHLIWKRYVNHLKSWTVPVDYAVAFTQLVPWLPAGADFQALRATLPPPDPAHNHATAQQQLSLLRSVYQRGISHPMTGLDQFWHEYEAFERHHSESLANVLVAEWLPRYQHARSVYLERNRVWTAHELKGGRLAVPPVGCTTFGGGRGVGATCATPGIGPTRHGETAPTVPALDDSGPLSSVARANAVDGVDVVDAELLARLNEERLLLSRWRRRAAYERTNPERLACVDHALRVRAGYREQACAFARHPEVWHDWSSWELLHGGSAASATSGGEATGGAGGSDMVLTMPMMQGDWKSGGNAVRAVAVLSLGMESLPDCAFLAQAQAEILERYPFCKDGTRGKKGSNTGTRGCIRVLEQLVDRSPTTLGFILLQRLVRRHAGIAAARAVFSRARRTLRVKEEDRGFGDGDYHAAAAVATSAKQGTIAKESGGVSGSEVKEKADCAGKVIMGNQQRIVTNRLAASVGTKVPQSASVEGDRIFPTNNVGYITWHLYAAHATLEHHISKKPRVAARVYELGLRR